MQFPELERITLNPMIMGGKPCIRGMRITVGTIVGLVASGASFEEILQLYPYLESEDIRAAVAYAAWRSEERETPLQIQIRAEDIRPGNAEHAVLFALKAAAEDLSAGALITIDPRRLRISTLPLRRRTPEPS